MEPEQVREKWDRLTGEKSRREIAEMIMGLESYWKYHERYEKGKPSVVSLDAAVGEGDLDQISLKDVIPSEADTCREYQGEDMRQEILMLLTRTQLKCVLLKEQGYNNPEIAEILGYRSRNGVTQIMRRVRNRLRAEGIQYP